MLPGDGGVVATVEAAHDGSSLLSTSQTASWLESIISRQSRALHIVLKSAPTGGDVGS